MELIQPQTRRLDGRLSCYVRPKWDDDDGQLGLQRQPMAGAPVEQFGECMLASGAHDNQLGSHLRGHIREHDGADPSCTRDSHATPAALRGSQNSVITRSCRSALV